MISKFLDIFNALWVGIWLNLRKYKNPTQACQCSSDSGKPRQTACDVILKFRNSSSVCLVCPAMRKYPEGWRCRIHKRHIRPLWRKTILLWAALITVLILGSSGSMYAYYRHQGLTLKYVDVLLPYRWHRIKEARVILNITQYNQYLQLGQWGKAATVLSEAYHLSSDLTYGIRLAQMWALLSQYTWSDQVFESLLLKYPTQREAILPDWVRMLMVRRADAQLLRIAEQELTTTPEHFAWARYYIDIVRQRPELLKISQSKKTTLHWLLQAEWQASVDSPNWTQNVIKNTPNTYFGTYFTTRLLLYHRQYTEARDFTFARRNLIPEFILQDLQFYNNDYPDHLRKQDLQQLLTSTNPTNLHAAIVELLREPNSVMWQELRPLVVSNIGLYPKNILFSFILVDLVHNVKDLTILNELQRQYPEAPLSIAKLYSTPNISESVLFYRSTIYFSAPTEILWQSMQRFAKNKTNQSNPVAF